MFLASQIFIFFATFIFMEGVAWFSHKYIMHGFLWPLHKDHHHKNHDSHFERNDAFFLFYAAVSAGFVILWGEYEFWPKALSTAVDRSKLFPGSLEPKLADLKAAITSVDFMLEGSPSRQEMYAIIILQNRSINLLELELNAIEIGLLKL